jgi:NADPH:quinone reductase
MRAFVVDHYAHPSQIPLNENAPAPKPSKDDDVLVDVHSAALNFFDVRILQF